MLPTKQPNANRNPASSTDSTIDDETRETTGVSAGELDLTNRSGDRSLREDIDYDDTTAIHDICNEHQIQSTLANYLLKLREYEIVIVCDDSGSMSTKVDKTENTRWSELCSIVKIVLKIAVKFDKNGVDLYFLNRGKYLKIKNSQEVDRAFKKPPSDYTPLVPVLKTIFRLPTACPGGDKKLLVLVATDGQPTDDDNNETIEELRCLMEGTRIKETTYVSFLLCTDDPNSVDYLDKWDRTMLNVDVTDDYRTERAKICRCQENDNFPFSYDDYIVKALVGSIIPIIDRLNERKIGTMPSS